MQKSSLIGCLIVDKNAQILYTNDGFNNIFCRIGGFRVEKNFIDLFLNKKVGIDLLADLFKNGSLSKTELSFNSNEDKILHLVFEGHLIHDKDEQFGVGLFIEKNPNVVSKDMKNYSNQSYHDQEPGSIDKEYYINNITTRIQGVVARYRINPDATSDILFISDSVEDLYGIKKEDALKDSLLIWSKFHEDDIIGLKTCLEYSAETLEPWDHIFRYYTTNNEIGYLQGYGTPQKLENGTLICDSITMDITKRIAAENEAKQLSSKLRAFIQSSPIAIFQIDPNGIVTDFWNSAAENIYGWTKDEIINKHLPTVSDENREEFLDIINDITITKKPKQFQVTRKNRFEENIRLDVTAGPLFDKYGKLTDLLIIANDITELEDYRNTLETAVREKEILLQEIHHRVKNNLAIVSGLLELQALKEDNEHDTSVIIEARNRIHSIAMVHEQLYQDMDFSHIDPEEYYRKLLKKLQSNTISDERDIFYDLKFDVDRININRAVPLGLLINELFTNSIKHAFTSTKGHLTLHFSQQGDHIRVYYEDDGPGFGIDEIRKKNTIGWQLIETLLLQLDSTYTMDTKGRFMLDFTFKEVMQGSQSHFR